MKYSPVTLNPQEHTPIDYVDVINKSFPISVPAVELYQLVFLRKFTFSILRSRRSRAKGVRPTLKVMEK